MPIEPELAEFLRAEEAKQARSLRDRMIANIVLCVLLTLMLALATYFEVVGAD